MSSLKDRISTRTDAIATARLPAALAMHPAEVIIGQLVAIGADGAPIVDFPDNPAGQPVPALGTAHYDLVEPGQAVALMFLAGDPARPLAIGVVTQSDPPQPGGASTPKPDDPPERLTLAATREIVLQCGRASMVLTRAGKVLVRGAYLSLRSSGVQRITGASVEIN